MSLLFMPTLGVVDVAFGHRLFGLLQSAYCNEHALFLPVTQKSIVSVNEP